MKEALKDNSKQTIDYISDINKCIRENRDITQIEQP